MTQETEKSSGLTTPRPRIGWLWLVILAILAVTGVPRVMPMLTSLGGGSLLAERTVGGPFSLVDAKGRRVTQAELAGKPYAMFFGYTHCPDVCPTTLQDMSGWLKSLGPDADKLRMVFVTVDPSRDTPATLAEYLQSFDPRILGLTGSEAEIADMLKAYRVYARKVDVKGSDYSMDHTAAIYLMDGNGDLRTVIGYGEKNDAALARLKELIGAS